MRRASTRATRSAASVLSPLLHWLRSELKRILSCARCVQNEHKKCMDPFASLLYLRLEVFEPPGEGCRNGYMSTRRLYILV